MADCAELASYAKKKPWPYIKRLGMNIHFTLANWSKMFTGCIYHVLMAPWFKICIFKLTQQALVLIQLGERVSAVQPPVWGPPGSPILASFTAHISHFPFHSFSPSLKIDWEPHQLFLVLPLPGEGGSRRVWQCSWSLLLRGSCLSTVLWSLSPPDIPPHFQCFG